MPTKGKTPLERDLEYQTVAEFVLAHLKVCGWQFTKAPPAPAHSTHDNRETLPPKAPQTDGS